MGNEKILDRYKHEGDDIVVEVGVNSSRQLFNERDPAPFRARDLDPEFVIYLVSAVEEFSLRTKMKIRILSSDEVDLSPENSLTIRESIRAYFQYEAALTKSKLRKRHRTARVFSVIGLATLIVCLSLARLIGSIEFVPAIANIASVSLIIIGWVAMWQPIESLLYDWWPIREQRQYFDKIAGMSVDVVSSGMSATSVQVRERKGAK